jgi:hypothetical protein
LNPPVFLALALPKGAEAEARGDGGEIQQERPDHDPYSAR